MNNIKLEVKKYRNKFYVYAGKSRISCAFKTEEKANQDLINNDTFYYYWLGSASVSVENSNQSIVCI